MQANKSLDTARTFPALKDEEGTVHTNMEDPEHQSLDEAGGILKELLAKPTFKDDVRAILKSLEGPDVGRQAVRTFLWQDIDFSLGIISSLPTLANVLVRVVDEFLSQLNEKFSPALLHGYLKALGDDLDQEGLIRLMKTLGTLAERVLPLFGGAPDLKTLIVKEGPVLAAKGMNTATAGINTLCRRDPEIIGAFLTHTIENLDKPALNDAVLSLVDAVLDQKLGILALAGGLVKRRGAKILRRFGLGKQGGRP